MKCKQILFYGGIAGLAGGAAEIVWVGLYAVMNPIELADIAQQVTASLILTPAAEMDGGIWPGLGIHLFLSMVLGAAFVASIGSRLHAANQQALIVLLSLAVLISIWAVNFFVVLPVINPAFVGLMPHSVTLCSKLLFALSMSGALLLYKHPLANRKGRATLAGLPMARL